MSDNSTTEINITLTFKFKDEGTLYSYHGYDDRTCIASSAADAMHEYIEIYCEDYDDEGRLLEEDGTPVEPTVRITPDDFCPYGYLVEPLWEKEPRWLSCFWERSDGIRMRESGLILVEGAETYEEACALLKAEIIKMCQ